MSTETQRVDVLAVMDRARDVLAETYAKYQTKIGPFASQSQQSNVELRQARDAVAELIEACRSATCQCPRGAWKTGEHPFGAHQHDCHLGAIPAALARVGGAA